MGSDADEFRFHFIGLGQLVKAFRDGMGNDENKERDADDDQRGEFRLVGKTVGNQVGANHSHDIYYAQNKENKTGTLPDAQIIIAAFAE